MALARMPPAFVEAGALRGELKSWLVRSAYPLWWARGVDRATGGFHEALAQNGEPLALPRRSRVQPRQMYSFSAAGMLGWNGPVREAVRIGLDFQLSKYLRRDGLFRSLVSAGGAVLDDRATLYDQAFALFGLAAAYAVLEDRNDVKAISVRLRERVREELRRPGSFGESSARKAPICANDYMHLFEACLAWHEADADPVWLVMADEIVRIALARFLDPRLGAVREFFGRDFEPWTGIAGRLIEPGHQFEWAWLLMRWCSRTECDDALGTALKLIETGESRGVDPARGVAVDALLDDFSVHDRGARLWPQTERIKAACAAAAATGEERYWRTVVESARSLRRYLDTPVPGLWRDRMSSDGSFVDEPAPASSFYHIVCAVRELDRTVSACAPA